MRNTTRGFFCLLLLCATAFAQQNVPETGKVAGNVYTNDYFRFTYTIPEGWTVRTDELAAKLGKSTTKALLYATKSPDSYASVAVTSRDFNRAAPPDAQAFLDALQADAVKKGGQPIGARWLYNLGARTFIRQDIDLGSASHYLGYVVGMARNYGLVFTIQADSSVELGALVRTITEAKFVPDWSTGVPAGQGCAETSPDVAGRAQRVKVARAVQEGLLVKRVQPQYPVPARMAHVQGAVVVGAIIGCDGALREMSVISGPPMLVKPAMEALSQWKYKPYMLNGKPVQVETTITTVFTLSGF